MVKTVDHYRANFNIYKRFPKKCLNSTVKIKTKYLHVHVYRSYGLSYFILKVSMYQIYQPKNGLVARSDACSPGIQSVAGLILGPATFFRGDWS